MEEKDDKVEKLIAPFKDWNTGELSFERVMSTIDAIVERRIEKLRNEMNAKIQKLQIEKTFQPETTNEGENKDIIEDKYKHTIADILTKNFDLELKTLTGTDTGVNWFVNIPSFINNSFHDYCSALRKKLDVFINSVKNDSSFNTFYNITIRKKDPNYSIYFASTTVLSNPKEFVVHGSLPDDIKITITDCNGNTNDFWFRYYNKNSIIECDTNSNFMLFNPVTREYALFYKSHKFFCVNHDDKNSTSLKTENKDENVKNKIEILKMGRVRHYKTKVWEELCHPEDISDQLYYHSDKHKNVHNKDLIINNIAEKLKTQFPEELDIIKGPKTKYCKDYNNIIVPDNYNELIDIIKQKMGKLIRCTDENFIHIIQKRILPSGKNAFTFDNPKFYSINYKQPNGELSNRFLITLINDDEEMNFSMEYLNNISIIYSENNSNFMIFNQYSNEYLIFYKAEIKKSIDKHSKYPYSKITSIAVDDVRKELEKDYMTQLNLLVGKNYDTYKNNYTITVPVNFKHFKHILRQRIKKLIKASSENEIITFDRFKNKDNYNTFYLNTVFSCKPESYSINTDINYHDRYRLTLHSKEKSDTFDLKYHKNCVIVHGNDSNYNFMIYDPLTNEYTLFVNSETMAEENYLN